ncbi:MAG TPA: VWA domain-containing protein [Blastocatellia bacterium]|nr:VWA domain-containing protein [Blastocatellia bacterium]
MKLLSCLFSMALGVGLLLITPATVFAQEPGPAETINIKTGQTVFVVAVRGDCARARPNGLINGREFYHTGGRSVEDRAALDRPWRGFEISERLEPDPSVKRELEAELRKGRKFQPVESADEADFVVHACGRYLYDVFPTAPRNGTNSRLPNRRLSAQLLLLPVTFYKEHQRSYNQLLGVALWKADAPEFALNSKDARVKELPPAPGRENREVVISGGPAQPPPTTDASAKQLAADFVKMIDKAGGSIALKSHPYQVAAGAPATTAPGPGSRTSPVPSAALPAPSSNSTELTARGGSLRLETLLVSVPVMVLDQHGKYVPGLNKSDFKVFEDGIEQTVEHFTAVEEPFSVVLMLDSSQSTKFSLPDIKAAALAFVEQLRPQDEVMIVSFDSRVWVDAELTGDRDELRSAIKNTHTGFATRLYDALYLVLTDRLRDVRGRKAIVLFSDGLDSISMISDAAGALERAEKYGVFVYPIQYGTERAKLDRLDPRSSLNTGPGQFRERAAFDTAVEFMKGLAARTGANYYEANTLGDVDQAFTRIAAELRQQYLLTYYPSNTKRDGRFRRITVKAPTQPSAIIRAREGYQAKGSSSIK